MFIKFSIYFILSLLSLISLTFSKEMFLDKEETGEINYDDGHLYYELTLSEPSEDELINATLIFTIESNKENIEEGNEIFSDPDIYISKTNQKPSNPEESTYYSEKYGNDILTVPNNDLKVNDTFYIGVYCQYKCRYKLRAYLSKEVELSIGKLTSFTIAKNNSMNFIVKIPDRNYEEFNIYSSGPFISEYKIYMSDSNDPSSQNSFKIIPVWLGTYMFSIRNTDREYCTNCSYHLIIQNNNKNADLNVRLNAYFQETITEIKKTNNLFDATKKGSKRCYGFLTEKNLIEKDKLLINLRLFSGVFNLDIYGFENPMSESAKVITNYSYTIFNHKIILLEKKDFNIFKNNNNYYNSNQDILYFCIRPRLDSSYTINMYYLNDSDKMQRFNILEPNIETLGYLSKNQITTYRYFDNYERNRIKVDIKFIFTDISGGNEYYLTYCYGFDCSIKREDIDNKKDKLIKGNYTSYNDYSIEIKKEDNACYKSNDNNHNANNHCRINAVVFCNGTDFCNFKIRLNVENIPLLMSPRKSYFNIIPRNKVDKYDIYVSDKNVTSIVIVLDTISGDAELSVNKIVDDKKNFVDVSFNDDFLPDVVRITPKKLNSSNVIGNYQVYVSTATFSSYNIYYYTTTNNNNSNSDIENKTEENIEVTASLTDGQFINDYFPNDIKYKIYKYEPIENSNNENPLFKFVITRIDIKFSFYVFSNVSDINIKTSNNKLDISGYKWSSDYNGELLISPSSEIYTKSGPFYILVYLDDNFNVSSQLNNKTVMQYYLGVTTYQTPFNLYEGVQHSLTLDDEYKGQGYWYIHNDINNEFNFEINILSGVVNVYIDVEKLDGKTIENKMNDIENNSHNSSNNNISNKDDNDNIFVNGSFYFIKRVRDFAKLTLDKEYFKNYCKNNNSEKDDTSCPIYIYIRNTRLQIKYKRTSQYVLVVHNINNNNDIDNNTNTTTVNEQIVVPGISLVSSLKVNETRYYYIEELQKRNESILSVNFENGYGDVFLRIPQKYEKNHIYPNETNYDYKAESGYIGKSIKIPKEVFDRITEENYKLQLLVTVKISNVYKIHSNKSEENNNVKITITYSNEPIRISQNIPITSSVITGERKYYILYFDENTKNIYISLSNMDGDADIYVKKGIGFPTPQDNDWYSTNSNHEHIDIHEDDKRFENDNIEGYYSLAIIGFLNTKYTLYVSNYDKNVLPLKDNSPVNCYCEKEGEKCYFRFDDVYIKKGKSSGNTNFDINQTEIIFTTKYAFGNGIMYAKILNDVDIIENNDEEGSKLYDLFPDEKNYDISNYESNQRNYLNFKVKSDKYQKDSLILLTYICSEETKVSINTAPLRYTNYYSYLDVSRENQYYLKYNSYNNDSIFHFYNRQDDDILYTFHSFLGSGLISIYYNESIYNNVSKNFSYDFKHLDEFVIEDGETVSNYIKNVNGSLNKKTINFKVSLKSDFGFYIKISYNKKWNSLSIGKDNTFLINKKNKFFGYFDILNTYKNIEVNVKINNEITKRLKIYVKINYLNFTEKKANDDEKDLFNYNIPTNEMNSDYSAVTDDVFGSAFINIDKFEKVSDKNKDVIIRALIVIDQFDINNTNIIKNNENDYNNKDTEINILVSPNVNNRQRIDAEPFEYYFNNISDDKTYKLYHLTKIDSSHSNIIIYLSVCTGIYRYAIFDYLPKNEDLKEGNVEFNSINKFGKDILILNNTNKKHYYLKIWKDDNFFIFKKIKLYFMFYYFSSNENFLNDTLNNNNINNELTYFAKKRGEIILSVPKINEISPTGETRKINDLEYNLFLTYEKDEENNLDSICYLSRHFFKNEENKMFKNIQVSNDKIEIKNLEKNKIAYINILIKNTKTGELITFNHIAVDTKYVFDLKSGNSIFIYIIIIILICIIVYLYNKLKNTEKIVNYEKNDIRNLTKIELGQRGYERIKYSNLSDTAEPI